MMVESCLPAGDDFDSLTVSTNVNLSSCSLSSLSMGSLHSPTDHEDSSRSAADRNTIAAANHTAPKPAFIDSVLDNDDYPAVCSGGEGDST